ncbi:hypothetical protein H5P28_13925 [Ruficoccus amylovorans]|uniref:Uncharacterized protein n=1 Tax=Ruficoccus amylovorans TaxID=1804625 RepID=A0A842HJM5_9BACT|nr:hypothetical protein [Ruficoccus amylovorans]MBC2595361.1 hypothetical protein [Ruficoccus amylovorans]
MRLSQELYNAGILGKQETRKPTAFHVVAPHAPRSGEGGPLFNAFQRREQSTKVNVRGWRALSHVLRLR